MVVVMQSEMGRTPTYNQGNGKDHWSIGSIMFLGPGIKGNRVIGATDEKQFHVPLDPQTLAIDKDKGIRVRPEHIHAMPVEELNPFRKVQIDPGKHSDDQIREMAPRLAIAVAPPAVAVAQSLVAQPAVTAERPVVTADQQVVTAEQPVVGDLPVATTSRKTFAAHARPLGTAPARSARADRAPPVL